MRVGEMLNRIVEVFAGVAKAFIRKDGPAETPYCVYSETSGKKFGCYKTKKEAEDRLAQMKKFKNIKEWKIKK